MECYNGDKIYDHASKEAVLAIKKEIPSEEAILKVSDIFKMLSSPSRLKILYALRAGKLCVHHIAKIVDMEISAVSHQL
ncbi:MAG: ArsR family transcriptional regulator, partial [Candidatus Odinarchaeota archaeon]|nr:ArsR family transcriptional regulator [Candidatus Odinarchaeota archaeon]